MRYVGPKQSNHHAEHVIPIEGPKVCGPSIATLMACMCVGMRLRQGTFGMRFISDLLLFLVLLIVVRFLDGMQYGLVGWSLFTLLGIWDPPR